MPEFIAAPPSFPPRPRSPRLVQSLGFVALRDRAMRNWIKRYGRIFEISIPFFGRSVVVAEPALVRSVWTATSEQLVNVQPNIGNLFGPGSMFALDGEGHRDRRRLLAPVFHGRNLKSYEAVIQSETLEESANWPAEQEFPILEPMNRITFNVILRTIFGSEATSEELQQLREIFPPFVRFASRIAFVPAPPFRTGRRSPWAKLAEFRTAFNGIVFALIDKARADPHLGERSDALAHLVRGRHDDGMPMGDRDICDELLTLIGAGHETTAAALSWVFERLRRHPDVLAELVEEVDDGGSEFLRATILEALRVRTVIDLTGRRVKSMTFDLSGWRIMQDRTVLVRIADLHEHPDYFPHPERFDPNRFRGTRAEGPAWQAFGGGARRCIGADFAIAEMDVVLRTVLQNFRIHTDCARDERSVFTGVVHVPKLGGRLILSRRTCL